MPKTHPISTTVPTSCITALDRHAGTLKERPRTYVLISLMDLALKRRETDPNYNPVHESDEEKQPISFKYSSSKVPELTKWRRKTGVSRAALVRNILLDAVTAGWLRDVS